MEEYRKRPKVTPRLRLQGVGCLQIQRGSNLSGREFSRHWNLMMCLCLLDLESISMSGNLTVGMTRFLKATELQQRQDLGTFPMFDLNGFMLSSKRMTVFKLTATCLRVATGLAGVSTRVGGSTRFAEEFASSIASWFSWRFSSCYSPCLLTIVSHELLILSLNIGASQGFIHYQPLFSYSIISYSSRISTTPLVLLSNSMPVIPKSLFLTYISL